MALGKILDDIRSYLPIQYPLGVFIHNNMLIAFEELPFEKGVLEASLLFGAKRTLDHGYYLDKWRKSKIDERVLLEVIDSWMEKNPKHRLENFDTKAFLFQQMVEPLRIPHRPSLVDTEWSKLAAKLTLPMLPERPLQLKAWKRTLIKSYGEDINALFHPLFIRFVGTYLDQGMASWHNPDSHKGLLESFKSFIGANVSIGPKWIKKAHAEIQNITPDNCEEWFEQSLKKLPFATEPKGHLLQSLLELRGWAGMINKAEREPHLFPRHTPKIKLLEYLAIYHLIEINVYESIMAHHGVRELKPYYDEQHVSYTFPQVVMMLEYAGAALNVTAKNLESVQAQEIINLMAAFHKEERCQVWQKAFDLSMRNRCLNSLGTYIAERPSENVRPKARAFFCIDDREESVRRHLEAINPEIQTHGVVGFFGIDIKFKAVGHPEPVIMCPPVVTPSRVVEEIAVEELDKQSFGGKRRLWGRGNNMFWYGTRGGWNSWVYTLISGPMTSLILLLRVFFPYRAGRWFQSLKKLLVPVIQTTIRFEAEDKAHGYTVPEMANIVATILKFTGIVSDFTDWNFMIGHGSTSENNPYKNAYGCGACSGKAGIPNSQIYCGMANDPRVRGELRKTHNIDIPDSAIFIASYHDTSTDNYSVYNATIVPTARKAEFQKLRDDISLAMRRNSMERCRHFASARHILDEKITAQHVLDRSANLAEPRPEYGHTNNALTIIGRRSLTKNLYLDRRSFLVSYDAATDPKGETLKGVLAGAVPVAGGISLDYYFSRIDNETYGSGTKLPLNITGLLGVMTGTSSDLRIGLARQMVELHEPVRITIVVEAHEEVVLPLIEAHPRMKRMVFNEWIFFALVNPETGKMKLFDKGAFKDFTPEHVDLPIITDSIDYAAHRKGPLPFAVIQKGAS